MGDAMLPYDLAFAGQEFGINAKKYETWLDHSYAVNKAVVSKAFGVDYSILRKGICDFKEMFGSVWGSKPVKTFTKEQLESIVEKNPILKSVDACVLADYAVSNTTKFVFEKKGENYQLLQQNC